MTDGICSIPDCDRPSHGRGWCRLHYYRWYHKGDPTWRPATAEERFWPRVDKSGDCWLWTGYTQHGYGKFHSGGAELLAHRVAYEWLVGPIPDGLQLDHMCHNADPSCCGGNSCPHRACVNPAHLLPSTGTENMHRSPVRGSMTKCSRGHLWVAANIYVSPKGQRTCRICTRIKHRERRRAA